MKNNTEQIIKRKLRVYIDTSIVGGFYEKEFDTETKALFQRLENKEIIFVISDVLAGELEDAPDYVKNHLQKYDNDCFENVKITYEALDLANAYVNEKVLSRKYFDDCRHIAIATINKVDVLASWNFKHIVNFNRIRGYNAVNLRNGYNLIEIRNPKELLNYGNEND
jgi:predicted nucleic acid-binding protein